MKTQLCKFADCLGKTIDKIVDDSDKIGISFKDGSYIIIEGEADYEGCFNFQILEAQIDPEYEISLCVGLGLYTKEEIRKLKDEKEEKRNSEQEKYDRELYLKLKKRFADK